MQRNQQCDWLQKWWVGYRFNRIAMDPLYHEAYCRLHCDFCFENNIGECFHLPYKIVKEMIEKEWTHFNDNPTLK